jgi:hypothetical protein
MGVVYKARQTALNRVVALKMILAEDHASSQALARFRREAEVIARLEHPNVVQIHEVGEHQGRPYFSLEFCAGGSLAAKTDGTPWPAGRAAELVEVLARSVQAAHQAGIIHRDLKPANVLLTADGVPKVTDFGLAKRLGAGPDCGAAQTATEAILGTPNYMAPEQARGQSSQVGPAADVYSLGAILYELLTGRPPFRAATAWDTLAQVISHEAVSPRRLQPKVPRDLETICLRCLHKDPHKRYEAAQDLADDLARFRRSEPIRARPTGTIERVRKWARRRPALAALCGAGLAALVALWGVVFASNRYLRAQVREAVAREQAESERALRAEEREKRALAAERENYRSVAGLMANLCWQLSELPDAPPSQNGHLRIGLSGRNRCAIKEAFEAYEMLRAAWYRRHARTFRIDVDCFEYGEALPAYQSAGRGYDLLLIDDPWLPMLHDRLLPLGEVPGLGRYLERNPPLDAFVPSLAQACKVPGARGLYGLPLLGNVEVLLYRKDMLPAGEVLLRGGTDEQRLQTIGRVCDRVRGAAGGVPAPFLVRFTDDSSLAEQFWEILRCCGYRDTMERGQVVLPRALAARALSWLRAVDPRQGKLGRDDDFFCRQLFREGRPRAVMGLGWPSWPMRPWAERQAPNSLVNKVGARMLSSNPVMGAWLLVIPRTGQQPEEALRAILTLTSSRDFQVYLAYRGCVPVLRTPLTEAERAGIPFLGDGENYAVVREALERASPRPRVPRWAAIEAELADCLREGREPRSIDGCLIVR